MKLWTRFKRWRAQRNEPPQLKVRAKLTTMLCPCCRNRVTAWRRYANGKVECVACADGIRGKRR